MFDLQGHTLRHYLLYQYVQDPLPNAAVKFELSRYILKKWPLTFIFDLQGHMLRHYFLYQYVQDPLPNAAVKFQLSRYILKIWPLTFIFYLQGHRLRHYFLNLYVQDHLPNAAVKFQVSRYILKKLTSGLYLLNTLKKRSRIDPDLYSVIYAAGFPGNPLIVR